MSFVKRLALIWRLALFGVSMGALLLGLLAYDLYAKNIPLLISGFRRIENESMGR